MAGYADQFNREIDKAKMMEVPPEKMQPYAGGDADATFRLAQALKPHLTADPTNLKVMMKVHHPALAAMTKTTETYGFCFDLEALDEFETEIRAHLVEEKKKLTRMIPAKVRRKYLTDKAGFSLSRPVCVRDAMFGYYDEHDQWHAGDGFGLKPKVYTKGTANEPRLCDREPSTSGKDHLPYFINEKGAAGEFVNAFIENQKAVKMLDTYIVGFRQVIKQRENGIPCILPQYNFKTNTKRTQSVADQTGGAK